MAPKGITRRKGTTDHGSSYEQNIAALLGVKCALEDDIEKMWMATNVEGMGAFDDLVLFVKKRSCSTKKVYLIQIKYKKNRPLNLSSGDNDLIKYQRSFQKIKEDFLNSTSPLKGGCEFEDIQFILFTNGKIAPSNAIVLSEYDSGSDFINTGKIFKITHDTRNSYDSDFLNKINFYSNQVDVSKIQNITTNEINKYFTNCQTETILKFFENWHSEYFQNRITIDKEDIQSVILEAVLSNYVSEPILTEFPKADIWNEVTSQFQFTFLRKKDHLAKIWQGIYIRMCDIFEDKSMDLVKWNECLKTPSDKINKLGPCDSMPPIKKNKASYTIKDLYLLLWHTCQLPIILNLTNNNNDHIDFEKNICAALSKLDSIGSRRRYIFIGEVTSNLGQYNRHFNILHIKRDIKEKILKNACLSLQSKEVVNLKELKLSDTALEKISPELLMELLQSVKKKVRDDATYIPRLVRQPIVAANVLDIPNVVFVIAANDNAFLNHKKFKAISWHVYKLFANKFIKTTNDKNGECDMSIVKYIIFNKDTITLKDYKDIEETINTVNKCGEQTVHYLRVLNETQLEWLNSNKNANQIKPFLVSNSEYYLSDLQLYHYLTFNILSGNTGEGKSTLLRYLENNCPSNVWVTKLNIREIKEYIEKGKFSEIKMFVYHQNVEIFNDFNEFWWELFQGLHENGNILITIDGLDEAAYNSNMENFLDAIKSLKIKTILATRPSLKNALEKKYDMPLMVLKPFTLEDCNSLLNLALKDKYNREENHINIILEKISIWDNTIGVPLLLKLFTSLFIEDNLLDFNNFDITDLFDGYIRQQLKRVGSDNRSSMRTLSRSALYTLYTEDAISKLFTIEEYFEDVEDKIKIFVESELIEKFNKNTPIFAHKSIAEFLVAKLFHKLIAESKSDIMFFLKSLFYQELETVRLFFDTIALKGSELQNIITGSNLDDLYNKINKDMVDMFGRHALHFAASYGKKCELRTSTSLWSGVKTYEFYNFIFDNNVILPCQNFERRTTISLNNIHKLFNKGLDLFKKDSLFKMDVFEFAIESGSLNFLEVLDSKNFIKPLENVNRDILLFGIVKQGCINLFKQLEFKNFNLVVLPSLDTLLHIALTNENFEMIKELCEVIPIDKPNKFGYSPLISWLTSSRLLNSNQYLLSNAMNKNVSFNDNQLQILNHLIDKKVNLNMVNGLGETPLHAFCNSHQSVFELLLNNGADVNKKTNMGAVALHYAAQYSLENIKLLLKYNPAVDIYDNQGYTPLCYAVKNNKIDNVKYLIKKGAHISPSKKNLQTPLNIAVASGSVDCVQLLLQKLVKINGSDAINLLCIAIFSGSLECIKLLLKYVPIIDEKVFHLAVVLNKKDILEFLRSKKSIANTNINMDKLLLLAPQVDDIDLIDIILKYGADVNAKEKETGDTVLHKACFLGSQKTVRHFINYKSLMNMENDEGHIPLVKAVISNNLDIVKIMVNCGSDLQKYGSDALSFAAINNYNDIIDYLISVGVEIDASNSKGWAPIHIAAENNLNGVKYMIRNGADVNIKNVDTGDTPLIIAAAKGFQDILECLIDNGANINEENKQGNIALTVASQQGHLDCVQFLVHKGSDVNNYGSLAIYLSSFENHPDVVDYLISVGADVNKFIDKNNAPIHLAVLEGTLKVVKYLLSKGADINLKTSQSWTPLMLAVQRGNEEIVRHLIEHGADVNSKTVDTGYTPLMIAAAKGFQDILECLIDNGANINEENKHQGIALTVASQEGHLDCVQFLVHKGSDVKNYGSLAIYLSSANHTNIVDYLISVGADVNKFVDKNNAPIHFAVLEGTLKVVKYLLSKGADINLKTSQSWTPLMLAAFRGNQEIVHHLIEHGAKLNDKNANQQIALVMAAQEGHMECLKVLIDKGSDLGTYGPLFIYFAANRQHTTVVDYLISKGADINAIAFGNAPIHNAVMNDKLEVLKYLVNKGSHINLKNRRAFTALMLAASEGLSDIVAYLAENGATLDIEHKNGYTALIMAAQQGNLDCVKLLLREGSDIRKYGPLAKDVARANDHTDVTNYISSYLSN